jgi:hypothetical protein
MHAAAQDHMLLLPDCLTGSSSDCLLLGLLAPVPSPLLLLPCRCLTLAWPAPWAPTARWTHW